MQPLLSDQSEPKLEKPGAGVPWPQMMMMRWVLRPLVAEKTPWEVSEKRFPIINRKILALVESLTPEQLQTKVLVPPMRALEDSSRYWSIAMTLEHLVIVSRKIMQVVQELDAGRVPTEKADTAKVKPSGQLTAQEIVRDFRVMCETEFPKVLPALKNRGSNTKFPHPWFGPMRAQGWYWLLPTHHRVHWKQMQQIHARLKK